MTLSIAALYAGILALIVLVLAVNMTAHGVKSGVSLGDGGIALIAGRVVHTWRMSGTDVPNIGRQIGQSLTWLSVAALAALNLSRVV
jgi:uncharacterized membrane protein YecN with MAPEG domain